jgi:hypothetical protein
MGLTVGMVTNIMMTTSTTSTTGMKGMKGMKGTVTPSSI